MNIVLADSQILTALGDLNSLWDSVLAGRTAVETTDRFAERGFAVNLAAMVPRLEIKAGESRAWAMLRQLLTPEVGRFDPATPIILATTVGEIEFVERSVLDQCTGESHDATPGVLLGRVKKLLGLTGRGMVLSSACASSSAAVARAASMVRRGEATSVLVVAADAVSEFVYSGFSTLSSLADRPAQPFDAARSGLSLGEAAGWALVTSKESETSKSISILGWGSTSDAWHMTAPDPQAHGLSRAIAKALAMAQRDPADIAFVAAHGTATLYSDAMELTAFQRALPHPTPVFSIKGAIGHTLGAAGLVQILVAGKALVTGVIPPTTGLGTPDAQAVGWVHSSALPIPHKTSVAPIALSTNSGFGGVNTAILLGRSTRS